MCTLFRKEITILVRSKHKAMNLVTAITSMSCGRLKNEVRVIVLLSRAILSRCKPLIKNKSTASGGETPKGSAVSGVHLSHRDLGHMNGTSFGRRLWDCGTRVSAARLDEYPSRRCIHEQAKLQRDEDQGGSNFDSTQRPLQGAFLIPPVLPVVLIPGKNHWGLGVETGGSAEHPYFTHGGANDGFQCDLVAYNNGDGAVIMTNSDSGGQLATEILRTIAYEYKWPDFAPHEINHKEITVSSDILAKYVGVYSMAPGVNMTITLADGQLISQMSRQGKVPLFAESETMFFAKLAEIEFPRDDKKGPASQLILHQNGRDMTAKRFDDAEAKKVADAAAAFDKRFKDQTPAPGSEDALRRMIEELRLG